MKRAVLSLTALALSLAAGSVAAEGEKASELQEIMKKLNSPTGLYYSLGRELKENDPQWADMKPLAKEVAMLAALLGKKTPPKGDKASWEKLTKEYAANAAALNKAVAARDQTAAKKAYNKMSMGEKVCNTCHKAHRKE